MTILHKRAKNTTEVLAFVTSSNPVFVYSRMFCSEREAISVSIVSPYNSAWHFWEFGSNHSWFKPTVH